MDSEVLTVMLEFGLEHKEDIPLPSKVKGKDIFYIAPEASIQSLITGASTHTLL